MYRQAQESARPVARLRGMSDLSGEPLGLRNSLQTTVTSLLASFGYRPLETPLLEPTELFLRKSGGELASQLLSFTDPAGRAVSLRPEFTAPAIRHYLEQPGAVELPARWYYCGPVFRFDGPTLQDESPARSQFTQIGAELLGSGSILADVELLTLAVSALSKSGIRGWTLRLADLDVLNSLLDPVGLSERARAFVVQSVPRLSESDSAISQLLDERALRTIIWARRCRVSMTTRPGQCCLVCCAPIPSINWVSEHLRRSLSVSSEKSAGRMPRQACVSPSSPPMISPKCGEMRKRPLPGRLQSCKRRARTLPN